MRTYKHLTMTDRLRIEKWLKMGMKPREVADKLRVHVSTIYRELKRGAYDRLDGGTWEVKPRTARILPRRNTKPTCGKRGRA